MEIKISVSAIVEKEGKILLVKELREGQEKYNQPTGYLETNESVTGGIVREVKEETGLDVKLDAIVGVYQHLFENTQTNVTRFCFIATVVGGELNSTSDEDVVEAAFFSKEQIETLKDKFRNQLVYKCITDYFSGKRYPLSIISYSKSL